MKAAAVLSLALAALIPPQSEPLDVVLLIDVSHSTVHPGYFKFDRELVPEAAAALVGTKVDADALKRLAAAVSAACRPIDDKRGTKVYRIKVAGVMARRAAEIALERARRAN